MPPSFRFPSHEHVLELAELGVRGARDLEGEFEVATYWGDGAAAFELLLALRIAGREVDPHAAARLLKELADWEAFSFAVLALGAQGQAVLEALFAQEDLDPTRSALAVYLLRRGRHGDLPEHFTKAVAILGPQLRESVAHACLELCLHDEAPRELSDLALTIKLFVDHACATPMREWMRTPPLFSHVAGYRFRPP